MNSNSLPELNLENKKDISKFINSIKREYFRNFIKIFSLIIVFFIISMIFYAFSYQILVSNLRIIVDQLVAWLLFLIYLLNHFFQLTTDKFSPTLINFLKIELEKMEFKYHRKYKTGLNFYIFNVFTISLFILINLVLILLDDYILTSLVIRILIIYIFSSMIIPILRGVFHDQFIVDLKVPYFIQIDFQFKLIKHVKAESQMIKIYMTSNKLGSKSDIQKYEFYKEISEKRWLPKKGKIFFPIFQFSPYLHFYENSNLINFKEHFLNILSAIREWDTIH